MADSVSRLYGRSFAFAFLSQVGFVLSNTMMAHYARWISFLGGDNVDIGWIMGAGAVISLLARPWIGQWIDQYGARQMWLVGYVLYGLGTVSNLLLNELNPLIYVCRSINMLGASFVFSSSLAYITHLAPTKRRTEAIGVLGCGGFLGIILGPFLGELILTADRERTDFVVLFLTASCSLIVPTVLLLSLPDKRSVERSSQFSLRDFARTGIQHWPGSISLVQMAFGVCMAVPFFFMTRFVDEIGRSLNSEFQESAVSWFFICYAGWGLTVRLASRRMPDRIGRRKVLLAGCATMGCGMLTFSQIDVSHPWLLLITSALICGTGHALMFHTGTALFLERFPSEKRGVGAALSLMVMDAGMICGAPVLGVIADREGYHAVFLTVAVTCFGAGVVYTVASIPVWRARLKTS